MTKPTIICVDDEMLVLSSLRNYLMQQFGNRYAIEIAESAEEALEILQELSGEQRDVPLVVSDQVMPGMKGDELLARIHTQYPKTLKILLTGQASAEAVGRAVNEAALYRYIAKPWDEVALGDTVRQALHRYFQEQDLQETNQILQVVKTELEQAVAERSAALEYRLQLQQLISSLSTQFVNQDLQTLDQAIQSALQHLGEFFEADRSYLFQIGSDQLQTAWWMSNTHEWCQAGIAPMQERIQGVPLQRFPWFAEQVFNVKILNLSRLEELPSQARAELAEFTTQGIRSLLNVPILVGGQVFGFVGFDAVDQSRIWGEEVISALQFMGDIIVNALQRQQAAQVLSQSEARNRAIVTALPDLAFRVNRQGVYLDYFPSPSVINLVDPVECLGKTLTEMLPPEIAQRHHQRIERALTTGTIQSYEQHLEFNHIHHVEEIRVIACGPDEVLFLIRDITQRKESERQLAAAKEAAESANHAKGIFLTNMSHELRTPLNAILGFAQMMSLDDNLNAEQQERIDIINRSGEHLLSLIDDILDLSKIEAGGLSVDITSFDLHDLLLDLHSLFQGRAQVKRLRFDLLCDRDLPQVISTDRRKLRQILINLLGNAIKFTPAGGRVWLRAEVEQTREQLLLVVEDTGMGIAPEEMDKLFRPFSQTESGLSVGEGTGLGLAICRQFVHLLGGEIRVHSDPGWGSIFSCVLPLLIPPDAELDSGVRRILSLAPGQSRHQILLVGEPTMAAISRQLEHSGFGVKMAPDLEQAFTLLQHFQPDLILVRMDQAEHQTRTLDPRIQRLRSALDNNSLPILGIATGISEEERQELRGRSYDDLLIEPVRDPQLFSLIARYLDVDYLYTETYPVTETSGHSEATDPGLEILPHLPESWQRSLQEAILDLDVPAIHSTIEQIEPQYPRLAQQLRRYVENFDYAVILEAFPSPEP